MADEITIRSNLTILKNNVDYSSRPSAFTTDIVAAIAKGPTPGAVLATTYGTDVDLSQLTTPGVCRIANLEADGGNFFEYGIFDPEINKFFPWGECWPGESYIVRLSRNFGEEYAGTGTGTSAATNRMRIKANGASVVALVEAFEK